MINETMSSCISIVEMDKRRLATMETSISSLLSKKQLENAACLAILNMSVGLPHSEISQIMRDQQISTDQPVLIPFCHLQEIREPSVLMRIGPRAILRTADDEVSFCGAKNYMDTAMVHFMSLF